MVDDLEKEINRLLQADKDTIKVDSRLSSTLESDNKPEETKEQKKESKSSEELIENLSDKNNKQKRSLKDIGDNIADRIMNTVSISADKSNKDDENSKQAKKKENKTGSKIGKYDTEVIMNNLEKGLDSFGDNVDLPIVYFKMLIDNGFLFQKIKTKNIIECLPSYLLIILITIIWRILDKSYDFVMVIPGVITIVMFLISKEDNK